MSIASSGWRLLTRPGCHLCEEFLDEISSEFPRLAALIESINVDSREDWCLRFGRSIPVLLDPSGAPVCEAQFDRVKVAAAIEQASARELLSTVKI